MDTVQFLAAVVGLVAVAAFGWTAIRLANYPAPWSGPWQVQQMGGWSAAANAAVRLAVLGAIAAVAAYPFAPATPTHANYGQRLRWFEPVPRPSAGSADLTWLVLVAAALAVIALAVVVMRRSHLPRRSQARPNADSIQTAQLQSLNSLAEEALVAMISAKDPRRAILACYAQMERSLAARGIPRSLDETALEYSGRLLRQAGAPSVPVRSLTALFHLAGFSTRPMNEQMKEAAITSLREISGAAQ